MEGHEEHSHLKIPIIIFSLLFFSVLGILLFSVFFQGNKKTSVESNKEEVRKSENPNRERGKSELAKAFPTPTVIPIDISDFTLYQSNGIEINHPQNWGVYYYRFSGGREYTFKPLELLTHELIPSLQVEIRDSTDSAILENKKSQILKAKRFKEEEALAVADVQALKISGVSIGKASGDILIDVPVQKTFLLFKKGNNQYILNYSYEGDKKDSLQEKFFETILSTLKI